MAENGKADQQPGAGEAAKVADNETADTLSALIDGMDEVAEQPTTEDGEQTTEAADEAADETTESAEETEEESEESDEEGDEDEHKSVFSDEAYKIFKERVGKEKSKRTKVEADLELAKTKIAELEKSADPVMKEAVSAAGIAPEFLDADTSKTIAEAEKLSRRIRWAKDAAKNPDGFEDEQSGKVYTPTELLAYAMELATDPDNMGILAEARSAKKSALARQKEAIAEGLKVLAAKEKAKKAISAPAKKKPSAPTPKGSAPAPSTSAPRRDFAKTGDIDDMIDALG